MGFGKGKIGNDTQGTFKKRNTWSLKESDTENVYRVFPAMHSLAEQEKWAQYIVVHWGFSGVDANDPTKTRMRPFNCTEITDRNRNKICHCPQCDYYAERKAEHDAAEAGLVANGATKAAIEEALGPLKGYLKAFSPDKKFYLAVMNQAGEFGHLKIGYKAKKLLDAKLKELLAQKKINGLALEEGVWFNFKRSGKGRETQDVVDVVTTEVTALVNGEEMSVDQIKKAPITEDVANKALEAIEDLTTGGGFKLTVEQIQLLVDCDGDPESIDKIMGITQRAAVQAPAATVTKSEVKVKAVTKEKVKVAETVSETAPETETKAEVVTPKISNQDFLNKFKSKKSATA